MNVRVRERTRQKYFPDTTDTQNLSHTLEKSLQDMKVIVWWAFITSFTIGSFFFEELYDDAFQRVFVIGERYEMILKEKVIPYLQERQESTQ